MRILLISANTERLTMTTLPLGLGFVTAAARAAGHDVDMIDLLREADPLERVTRAVAETAPGVIGISIRNIDDQEMAPPRFLLDPAKDLVAACRRACRAPVVIGGAGYSIFPGPALAYLGADFGVRGEGEVAFPELIECLEKGRDPAGLADVFTARGEAPAARRFNGDLGAIAAPDGRYRQSGDPADATLWVPMQSRRGCPHGCSYCSTPAIEGRARRFRPPEAVVEEFSRAVRDGYRRFHFVDNTFNIPPDYALELSRRIRERRLGATWRCIVYPLGIDEELVAAMADAGCTEVSLGFESGAPAVLERMNKRFGPADVRIASELFARHGIARNGFLLLGGPGETRDTVEQSLDLARSLSFDTLRVSVGIRIYPETRLAEEALQAGLISPDDDLLQPRFFVVKPLEDFIRARLAEERLATGMNLRPAP